MNKRSAKKYIQYRIADAINIVSLQKGDEAVTRKKIDELIGIYDQLIPQVNQVSKPNSDSSAKKHFSQLYESLAKNIHTITGHKL